MKEAIGFSEGEGSMPVRIDGFERSDEAPFHRYVLRGLRFSQLSIYKSTRGLQKTKKKLSPFVAPYSVTLKRSRSAKRYEGLPLPLGAIQGKHPGTVPYKWVLGYHDLRKISAFVLFPCADDKEREKNFDGEFLVSDKDLPLSVSGEHSGMSFSHSLEIDELLLWPKVLHSRAPDKDKAEWHLPIPEDMISLTPEDFGGFDGRFFIGAKPFYSLFFDPTPCLIFLKQRFASTRVATYPLYTSSASGITWVRQKEYDRLQHDLLTFDESHREPEWWLRDVDPLAE